MRQIKFRAIVRGQSTFAYSNGFIKHKDGTIVIITKENDDSVETSPIIAGTLMQYTGLKDKNGVDIYEGDILGFERYNDFKKEYVHHFEVTWDNENAGWTQFSPKHIVAIIGNIYENPELLKP